MDVQTIIIGLAVAAGIGFAALVCGWAMIASRHHEQRPRGRWVYDSSHKGHWRRG